MTSITITDGPPGVGKTTHIVQTAPTLPGSTAVVSYTKEAAATVRARSGGGIEAATIYALTKDGTRPYWSKGRRESKSQPAYTQRAIRNTHDPAAEVYRITAPGRRPLTELDHLAHALHGWDGSGPPPFDLAAHKAVGGLTYPLPLARALADGRLASGRCFDTVIVDEGQDMSALEMAAAAAIVKPGGRLLVYGDPGQAVFMNSKGSSSSERIPPAWRGPGARSLMRGGHRVGEPVAGAASRVLRPIWDRPSASFAAPHETQLLDWDDRDEPPIHGLVLGYSRDNCLDYAADHDIPNYAVLPSVTKPLTICTGHAAKGAEADDVYLLPWGAAAFERLTSCEPYEIRLLYTMMTRARLRLHVSRALRSLINVC